MHVAGGPVGAVQDRGTSQTATQTTQTTLFDVLTPLVCPLCGSACQRSKFGFQLSTTPAGPLLSSSGQERWGWGLDDTPENTALEGLLNGMCGHDE